VAFDRKETLLLVTERKNNAASGMCTRRGEPIGFFRGTKAGLAANRGYPVLELIGCFLSGLENHSEKADEKFGDHGAAEDQLVSLDVSAVPP
jgi:hypothetical protein